MKIPSAILLALALALLPATFAGETGDVVTRFAEASPGSGVSIAIPGYEKLGFAAGETAQAVDLRNPPENACVFFLTLTLDGDGEALWTGGALQPGEAFTTVNLTRALAPGEYPATLRYDCYSMTDCTPLNAAEIRLTIEAR